MTFGYIERLEAIKRLIIVYPIFLSPSLFLVLEFVFLSVPTCVIILVSIAHTNSSPRSGLFHKNVTKENTVWYSKWSSKTELFISFNDALETSRLGIYSKLPARMRKDLVKFEI